MTLSRTDRLRMLARQHARKLGLDLGFSPAPMPVPAIDMSRTDPQLEKLKAVRVPEPAKPSRLVLFNTLRGDRANVLREITLAQGLRLRGAACRFVACDGALSACTVGWNGFPKGQPCALCHGYLASALTASNIPFHSISRYVRGEDTARIAAALRGVAPHDYPRFGYDGLPIGEWVMPTVFWWLRKNRIDTDDERRMFRDFLFSGALYASACRRLLAEIRPDTVVTANGLLFEQRIMGELANATGIRVVCYGKGKSARSVFFGFDKPACRYDVSALWEKFRNAGLTVEQEARLDRCLAGRAAGTETAESYWTERLEERDAIRNALGLDPNKMMALLLTNVSWDTAVTGRDSVFPSMFEWVRRTVEWFRDHPQFQLVVRVHPAEVKLAGRETREGAVFRLREAFPELPPNVKVVPPDLDISTYSLMDMAAVGLPYCSTAGIEMAARGIPVVTAARADYARRGFTRDPSDAREYASMIERLLSGPVENGEFTRLARRYAYTVFFRVTAEFDLVDITYIARPGLAYDSADALLPGRNLLLDSVCDSILNGTDFDFERVHAGGRRGG